MSDIDTKTLPRIGGTRRDAEIWKFRIESWFKREGVTTDDNKFSYIISSAEDDVVRVLKAKEIELGRAPKLDECVEVIKRKYWRENRKDNKLRQFKRLTIEPGETVYDFNTRYLELYDELETNDRSTISVMDYENALRPRPQIYQKIAMEEYDSLEDACSQAEKYENILQESYPNRNIGRRNEKMFSNNYNHNNNYYPSFNNYDYNFNNPWNRNFNRNQRSPRNFNRMSNNNKSNNYTINNSNNIPNNSNNNDGVDDLVTKMENLHIKTCYFCQRPGHLIRDCEELARLQSDPNFLSYLNAPKN